METGETSESDLAIQVARLFPNQGNWSEADYFGLPSSGIAELVDGRLEVAPVPSVYHQILVLLLQRWFNAVIDLQSLGLPFTAPTRLRIGERHFREPDLM